MNNLDYPIPVLELVTALKQLPGIGTRGAERMALWMLQGHMGGDCPHHRPGGGTRHALPRLRLLQHGRGTLRRLPG